MLYLPTDPPSAGRFALNDGKFLGLDAALELFLTEGDGGTPEWRAAALAGLTLIAHGKLRPAVSPAGHHGWRIGPLEEADAEYLHALAGALPAAGFVSDEKNIPDPADHIRAFWDALADRLGGPWTPAGPTDWLRTDAPPTVVLRIALPLGEDAAYTVTVQLRSAVDPSLLIDAADLWQAPPAVAARFGANAEEALLVGLRRASVAWPPLAAVLDQTVPRPVEVADESITQLIEAAGRLDAAGVELLLPHELLGEPMGLTAVATPSPTSVTESGFKLGDLLEFTWQPTLGGDPLTAEEITLLAAAKRPLVRLRGQWVRLDPALLARLRRKRKPVAGVRALAAALTGTIEEGVRFQPTGDLAALTARLAAPPDVPVPAGLEATLRPYQEKGFSWLAGMAALGLGGCLADDMGLGKTIQVIALHLHRGGRTLVVCPTSLLGNWEREIRRFAPEVPVVRFHGAARSLPETGFVLTTYGVVRTSAAELKKVHWGLVVADEAQYVKNPLSRTARQLRTLPADARIALTGTPVENRLSDLWALLDWTTPGLLGSLGDFRSTVAVPVERFADPAATETLASLIRPFLLRRRKADPGIAPELPAKTETDRIVPLTTEQGTLYRAVVDENLALIAASTGMNRRGQVLALLTALKQVCNHPAQYLKDPTGPLPGRSGKLDALDDLLDVILAEGESVLIFSQYVQMCRLLERHLAARGVGTLFLSGRTRSRSELVERFQNGEAPVFLLSLKAGGVGLNLTRATHVVHYDRWWNPAVEEQATDRAYRIGQDRPVQVHRLITEGTVEDRIAALLTAKRALSDAVVGDLSDADLAALVSL